MDKETFFNRLREASEHRDSPCVRVGKYDGEDFLIVDSWRDWYLCYGILNEFEGLGDKPYTTGGETLVDYAARLEREIEAEDEKNVGRRFRLRTDLADARSWIAFLERNALEGREEIRFDSIGLETGFSDEYDCCAECENIVRTSPDHYGWTPPVYLEGVGGYVCNDCAKGLTEDILTEYSNRAANLPDAVDTAKAGLAKVNDGHYENGLYGGQTDDPKKILAAMEDAGIDCWFRTYPGQFDVRFDVYVRSEELEKAREVLSGASVEGVDPAENLKKALQNMPISCGDGKGGVSMSTVNLDTGEVTTKVVSKEDFIKGVK